MFFKFSGPILLLASSFLVVIAACTRYWIINRSTDYVESILMYCVESICRNMARGIMYRFFVQGFLLLAATYGSLCAILVIIQMKCLIRHRKMLNMFLSITVLLPAIHTVVAMSIYTWKYTPAAGFKYRGWSYLLGWSCFPLFLAAAVSTIYYLNFHKH
ncbi:epithelial membrane protein 1-like [Hemicordylus capensis]|uniref:epithelial membrane protein 1-like n=1 Tax=Hemicordylus capensis TaxID=884348 RepID=UPI0023033E34|nr:epithelial membrane protein 1-like [Hemicordylus capensis]